MKQTCCLRWVRREMVLACMLLAINSIGQMPTHVSTHYYASPSTVTVTNTFTYPVGAQLTYFYWYPEVPEGFTVSNVQGDGAPWLDGYQGIGFLATTFPNPVVFRYDLTIGEGLVGEQKVHGHVWYNVGSGVTKEMVSPDPLTFVHNIAPAVTNELELAGYRTKANVWPVATLLAQAADADDDTLVLDSMDTTGSQGGTISRAGDTLTYTPPAGTGRIEETFTYTVSDGKGGTATGTVKVNVTYGATMLRVF